MNTASSEPKSSRERLLAAARDLIGEAGYEQASTAAIARRAATSESQLIRNFGGKAGMLNALFDESWTPFNARLRLITSVATGPRALSEVLAMFLHVLEKDDKLARLFLFEGFRIRGPGQQIAPSNGYFEFVGLLCQVVQRGQRDGTLNDALSPDAIVAALLGAAQSMVRERIVADPLGAPVTYSNDDIRNVFEALLGGLRPKG